MVQLQGRVQTWLVFMSFCVLEFKSRTQTGDDVYEPAEDTFVFLDGLEKELKDGKLASHKLAVEIGSGNGLVSAAWEKWSGSSVISVDINPRAAQCTFDVLRQKLDLFLV